MQLVETVVSNAKFHLSQDKTSQSTVTNVFQSINQNPEEVQVAEDLVEEAALEEEAALTEDHEKCTRRLVETVATNVKYHSSQHKTNQSTAENVFRNINHKTEEVQDLTEEVQDLTEEVQGLTEDREKCTKQLVETVVMNVKYHSSQDKTNQSTAQNVFRSIEATDDNKITI